MGVRQSRHNVLWTWNTHLFQIRVSVSRCTKLFALCTNPINLEPVNLNDLVNYRRELVAEHQSELAAIDRLIARERGKQPEQNDNRRSEDASTIGSARGAPVAQSVQKALGKIGNGHFTTDHIIAVLNQMGVSMEGWGPRAVGVNLWRRANTGELGIVQKGTAGRPVIYRKT
jgi:hypothetical protein